MTNEQFNEIVNDRVQKIQTILTKKGQEYGAIDRLHNFRVAARIDNETMLEAAWGMFKKHLVSIMDIKDALQTPSIEMINEKFGDAINYLILMEAILIEEIQRRQHD